MKLRCKSFSSAGMFTSARSALESAARDAAAFAETLPRASVVSISQSHPQPNHALITVWYDAAPAPLGSAEMTHAKGVSDAEIERIIDS